MFYVLQNESTADRRRVPILLTDAATGTTAQTSVAINTIYPYVNINGGSFAGGAGTVAEAGFGQYYYEYDPTEITILGLSGIHVTAAGCRDYDAIVQVAALNVYSAAGNGISAYDVWSYDYLVDGPVPLSAAERLEETRTEAYNANNNANTAASQTVNIPSQVWGEDLSAGPNSPYAAGTAGTILYDLSLGGSGISAADVWNYVLSDTNTAEADLVSAAAGGAGLTAGDVWNFDITGFGGTNSAAVYTTQTFFTVGNIETYVSTQTPTDIWSYSGIEGRTITGGTATTVTNPVLVSTSSMTGIAGTVWSTDISGYSSPSAGNKLNSLTSGSGLTAGDVWSYATRTITGGTITTVSDKTGYSLSGTQSFNLTGNITGNVSGSVGSVSGNVGGSVGSVIGNVGGSVASVTNAVTVATASMTGIAGTVWSTATRTITGGTITTVSDKTGYSLSGTQSFNLTGNITGNVSGSVGSVTSPVSIATASMTGIAGTVWSTNISSYTNPSAGYSLSTAGSGGVSAADVWNYVLSDSNTAGADLVSAASGGAGISAGDVWSYATRTTTGGTITSVTNGVTVSTNNDKTGYALSTAGVNAVQSGLSTLTQVQVGNTVDASLLSVGLTSTVTGRIDATVSSRLASASYVIPPTTAAIASTVWSYGTRTLTSGGGITAGDVWTYDISGITASGSAGKQLNDASSSGSVVTIVNGPYRLNSTAEGTDGRIDILQDSVQTIELSLVNTFGSPINISGNYDVSVDIYDEASELVHSYVPSIQYALGGILNFDIDTIVTGVIGRYSVVVSLTDGDVIQVGPLQILVRPL